MEVSTQQKHFVLVHGACHGAWSWYKITPKLEAAGHKVTAVDLSASGVNTKKLEEIHTLDDYSSPLLELMASIPPREMVVLVGHSFGGSSLALAVDKYPEKVSVAVFVAAFMPDCDHAPSYVFLKKRQETPTQETTDNRVIAYGTPDRPRMALLMGPKYLSTLQYQNCSAEDLALAKMLVRPSPAPAIVQELTKSKNFSKEGYGSVKRVYIVCKQDLAIREDYQRWQIENFGVTEVKEIEDADHLCMFSRSLQLCQYLVEIAHKY